MKLLPTLFRCSLVVAAATVPSLALAADPTTAGSANIGTHGGYGPNYAGFWRTGSNDYTLLTDGTNSFFNAPSSAGALYFRGQNADWATLGSNGLYLNAGRVRNETLLIGGGNFPLGIGRHPSYPSNYIGIWSHGACFNCVTSDYSFLTDSMDTFVNAPLGGGSVHLRVLNEDKVRVTSSGFTVFVSTAEKPGGGSWSSTSDARVKKDIRDLRFGLDDLEKVRPVTYKYNGLGETTAGDTEYVGVVAQELERALPFMVSSEKRKMNKGDKDVTDIKKVDPSAFTYVLINAVKQLSAENKQMKKLLCMDHPKESFCGGSSLALK